MIPIAEARLSIKLDRERAMIFNVNTMSAYEEKSGKFYWDTMLNLFDTYAELREKVAAATEKNLPAADIAKLNLEVLRHISARELHALLWASIQEYPKGSDDPIWPLTMNQVGRLVRPSDTPKILNLIVQGYTQNAPTKEELGEASGAGPALVAPPAEAALTASASGGPPSIALDASAFD